MNKEDIVVLAQLLSSMKDSANKLEKAQKTKNLEEINRAKREILSIKEQINARI
jgi:hypothetical protein